MSADLLEFLKKKFMDELEEAEEKEVGEEGIPLPLPLRSYFEDIKGVLQGKSITVSTPVSMKDCLYNLTIALQDCILFLEKRNKASRRYSLRELCFLCKTKRKLLRINKQLLHTEDVVSTPLPVDIREKDTEDVTSYRAMFEKHRRRKAWEEMVDRMKIDMKGGLTKEIAMVGIGGSGKTFTARAAFFNFFEGNRIWIDLSEKKKGEIEFVGILKQILEQCGGGMDINQGDRTEEEVLLEKIRNVLEMIKPRKRLFHWGEEEEEEEEGESGYIMVFDGIWDINVDWYLKLRQKLEWHKRRPWTGTNLIITTTRLPSVAKSMVGSNNCCHMPPPFLSDSQIWDMFLTIDLASLGLPKGHPTLEKMKKEIIDESAGLPLAAFTLRQIMSRHVFGEGTSPPSFSFDLRIWINPKDDPEHGNYLLSSLSSFSEGTNDNVFDISHIALNEITLTLGEQETEQPLMIMIIGGDATINWVLQSVNEIEGIPLERILFAMLPLGNQVHISALLGWGDRFLETNFKPFHFLKQMEDGNEIVIDSWNMAMRTSLPDDFEIPKTLHLQHVSQDNLFHMGGDKELRARFWNYFIIGLDAQELFGALKSKSWPKCRGIILPVDVKIKDQQQKWKKLNLHPSIKSIVCLNMPSFPGGLDPWGEPNLKKKREKNFTESFVDDGILEIIGFRDAWYGENFLPLNVHPTRLAQTHQIFFEVYKGEAKQIFLSFDGTRWKQPTPIDDDTYSIEVTCTSQTKFVATTASKCKRKPKNLQHDESPQQASDLYKELPSHPPSG